MYFRLGVMGFIELHSVELVVHVLFDEKADNADKKNK